MNGTRQETETERSPPTTTPPYEPPAIAWDEAFEPLTAASFGAPNGPNMMSELQRCNVL
ncbi:hypothetical protein [Anaeromyxobacter oryzae]|uniref:Uncharacterized protein n=1 Tax=Anaeromyxobacter oryzae TaxID=2918170 RepID=A0ABN6MYG3_9BACT|nr:hypothetical protein [Anaeromyxobacter oryzae]BDG05290.1 hypothetical protein AMOR_42860 [Anaeromyxobacter oryzae]